MTYALIGLAYLLGATPTSYWVGRALHGVDLREQGSGNLGATNAFRVLGWQSALPVVLVDVAKGFVPVWLFADLVGVGLPWRLAYGSAAILGHMFSPWVAFRGGKGIATSAGVFLAMAPWAVLGGLVVWLGLTLPTGYVSLGSIGAAFALPILIALTPHQGGRTLIWFASVLAVFVIWKHRSNIGRLRRGEENHFRRKPEAKRAEPTT
ncbi:MAG: glycerol-3-phosphate 1-O-acyltransferase PlsY [Gemmatimonadetes bacterium]|nr:glycerol-3-phosphate 1-O-acyltransferase PlsY [Gemmatimonadota bacterium]MDA1104374.1 glycerol-3-phosphate 1-O-acyltransferase PlsY [Gemmatimonadota bacterium]